MSQLIMHAEAQMEGVSDIIRAAGPMLIQVSVNGYTQQTQSIFITFVQRRHNVFEVGPTLYKCYKNVLCLLGILLLDRG